MRAGGALFLGVILNLGVALAPLVWLPFDGRWLRSDLLCLVAGLTLLLWGDAAARGAPRWRPETAADRQAVRGARWTGFALLLLVWATLVERQLGTGQVGPIPLVVGATLLGLGAAFRAAAVRRLGSQFVTEVTPLADDRLVRSGVYAVVRHPSETGLLLAAAGIPILLGSYWTACLAFPVFVGLMQRRVSLEETALLAAYGAEYEVYCTQVGGVCPKWPWGKNAGVRCSRESAE